MRRRKGIKTAVSSPASEDLSPILASKRMSRDAFIYRLNLLGYSYNEIEAMAETSRPTISGAVKKLNEFKNLTKSDYYEKHKSPADIAEYYKEGVASADYPLVCLVLLAITSY